MPVSGPYILQVVQQTTQANADHYVPGPILANTPAKPGDYSIDPVTGRRIDYLGDGQNSHSWGYVELVSYPPDVNQ